MDIISSIYTISISEWVAIILYLLFFIIQLIFYFFLFRKPYLHAAKSNLSNDDTTENKKKLPGISVIITAKNEAENLRNNLPSILNQDYPNLQVIVVNNASSDSTDDVLDTLRSKHPILHVTFIPVGSNVTNNKKLALTVGIKAAKHDILLFTEPDTKPLSTKWVYEYAKTFDKQKDIVLGACQLKIEKSHFKKYILFDNLFSGINYTSMALAKKPFMGIGRNMAFRKNLFFDNKGFSSLLNIEDGEDNVFINRIATDRDTAVLLTEESMVVSNVAEGILSWKNIKTKYLTTRKHYNGKRKELLSFEIFSRYAFYTLFIVLCVIGIISSLKIVVFYAILLILLRYLIQLIVINKSSKVYNAGSFYSSIPLFDILKPLVDYLFLKKEKNRNDIMSDR